MITVVAHIHPFSPHKRIEKNYEAGITLAEIISDLHTPSNGSPIILVDGIKVDDVSASPADGASIVIRNIPRGAGNTNTENVGIGKMAVGVAAFLVGIALFPLGAGAGIISALVFSGIGLLALGGITYSMLSIYDPIKTFASESLPSLRGGQNKASKWGKIPLVLGKHLVVPNLAAAQYTEVATSSGGTDGDTQYLRQLFCLGYAPLKISQIKLGENLVATNVADVRNGDIDTSTGVYEDVELEIYQDGTASVLYPETVLEDAVGAQLPCDEETWRTTDESCTKISWDIWFPMGIYKVVDGVPANKTVTIEVRSRAVGSGTAWASCTLLQTLTLTKANATTLRYSSSATVASGQYEVGVKRITADDAGQEQSAATWMYLRSIKTTVAPVAADVRSRHVYLAVKAKASDTVNGALDTLSCVAEAVAPDYSGTGSGSASWVSGTTANPAAMLLLALRGTSNPRPVADTKIDWARLEEFHAFCETNGHECNAVVSSGMKMRSLLQQIAQCGRASLVVRDGLYSVVIDSARTTIVQHFTPRNVRDFRWTRAFDKIPHALRMSFISEADSWTASERLVCDDDYTEETATEIEKVDVWGITDEDAVWKKGRYMLAGMRLRPEMYQFETDAEGIVCEPGDLIAVAHDAIVVGLVPGARIKSVTADGSGNATALVLDTPCPMEAGGSYGVRVRLAGGASVYRAVTTSAGEQTTITLATSIPAATVPAVGDLVTFGEADIETIKCIVIGYEALEDLGVRIYCVDQADAIHSADSGTIPAYVSHVSRPPAALPQSSSDEDIAAGLAEARAAQATATAATTSLAPAAIAQHNPAYTPELPDDPAGVAYQPTFATTDSWAGLPNNTVSVSDGRLISTLSATGMLAASRSVSFSGGKMWTFYFEEQYSDSYRFRAVIGGVSTIIADVAFTANTRQLVSIYIPAGTVSEIRFANLTNTTRSAGSTAKLDTLYIGTGASLSPTLDTSGNGNHLTNTAAVPVDFNGRKWWYGNGATAGLYNASVAIPDIVHFHCRAIPTASAATKGFIVWGSTGTHLGAFRKASAADLIVRYPRASDIADLTLSTFFTEGAETVLDIEWNFTAQTISVKRDSVVVQEYSGLTTMVKPSATALYLMRTFAGVCWLGYYTEAYITNQALSAAQIRDLYVNGLPAELYTPSDYRIDTFDDDGKLSVEEKAALKTRWLEIYYLTAVTSALSTTSTTKDGDFSAVTAEAIAAGLTAASAEVVLYVGAANAIRYFCWNSSTGVLNNMAAPSTVTAGALDELLSEYRTAYNGLRQAILNQRVTSSSTLDPIQSNGYHQVPVDSGGTPTTYVGTNNLIQVFEGITHLQATTGTPGNGQFKVVATGTNITAGAVTVSGLDAAIADASSITADAAYITFAITGKSSAGTAFSIYMSQTITKSRAGADAVVYSLATSVGTAKVNSDGAVSPSTVSATRYKKVGAASKATTTDGTLKYQRSSDASETATSNGTGISIAATDTYIDFFFYDASAVLDVTVRVPIIVDGLIADVATYAPRYLGVGLLAADDSATFRLDTVDSDGDITTGSNTTAHVGDSMVNHDTTNVALGIYVWSGTEWTSTDEANYRQLAWEDILNLSTGGIEIPGIVAIQTAIIKNLMVSSLGLLAGGKLFSGAGNYNSADTPAYLGADGKFSLGSALAFDGTDLSLTGTVTANAGRFSAGLGSIVTPDWTGTLSDGRLYYDFYTTGLQMVYFIERSIYNSGGVSWNNRYVRACVLFRGYSRIQSGYTYLHSDSHVLFGNDYLSEIDYSTIPIVERKKEWVRFTVLGEGPSENRYCELRILDIGDV